VGGARLKPEQALYGLRSPKLAPEGIEPETFGGANSKITSQPLSQPQMSLNTHHCGWSNEQGGVTNKL